ncbi:ABC-F family ATP-binding cassette domain-containing protein [Candidatus Margulisiibacteriota bacterium]
MNLISVQNLSCSQGVKTLLENINFGISSGQKIALIGVNGCGKTTLLSLIANISKKPNPAISTKSNLKIVYLAQIPVFNPEDTIITHLFASDNPMVQIIKNYEQCLEQLKYDKTEQLERRLSDITSEMDRLQAWEYEARVSSILNSLDIYHLDQKMNTLSGGMIKKIALAQIFMQDMDLLILDEPTNHLDIKTIEWLESMLKRVNTTILMVTHDRYFMDKICNRILEIDQQNIFNYMGNYESFLEQRALRYQNQERQEKNIQTVLRVELEWLKKSPKARSTKQKARKQRIDDMINRHTFSRQQALELDVSERRLGKKILELKNVSKSFSDLAVIKGFSYAFKRGEKIGIIGSNGTGKTTLLNIIANKIVPDSGGVDIGINTVFGYFDQHSMEFDLDKTIYEHIKDYGEFIQIHDGTQVSAAKLLERFLFNSSSLKTKIGKLSGGERRRLHLVCMLLNNPNFLLFDEPTNDLDIKTLSILEDFLLKFKGCLIIISHDRYFMDRVVDNLLVFEGLGEITKFAGGYTEYVQIKKELDKINPDKKTSSKNEVELQITTNPTPKKKLSFKEQQEFKNLELEIERLEVEKKQLEGTFTQSQGTPQEYLLAGKRLKEINSVLDNRLDRWECLADRA